MAIFGYNATDFVINVPPNLSFIDPISFLILAMINYLSTLQFEVSIFLFRNFLQRLCKYPLFQCGP